MPLRLPSFWLMAVSAAFGALGASVPKPVVQPAAGVTQAAGRVPVLVELFTSEACPACSAAQDVLRHLEATQPIPGVEVIGIEMRMDSWNAQGFRDPFVLRQLTNRQNEYVRLFNLDNLLTPQMVIGGQTQSVGDDPVQAATQITRAAKAPKAQLEVYFESASLATVKLDKLPSGAQESEIWIAVTEGSSEGGSAHQVGVVRSLVMLGTAAPGEPTTYSMHLRFNPRWRREDLKYVVFVQERASRRIWAATVVTP